MRKIDLEVWSRSEHFKIFSAFDYPHFNMCANMDLTTFYAAIQQQQISITIGLMYVLSRAANEIPEFRYRIQSGEVIEYEVVHPSATIMSKANLFGFSTIEFSRDFPTFATRAAAEIARVKESPDLTDPELIDNLLFMSAIPWVSFTSFMHPIHLSPIDSIPRFAWGKFFQEGKTLKMPLSVQAHHALMDGFHMGRYYELVQDHFDHPNNYL